MNNPFRVYILILSLLLLASCSKKNENDLAYNKDNNFTLSDELSRPHVTCFAEDKFGHIWIGTARGLNKYTGTEYQQFFAGDDSTSLPDNHISDLLFDSKKRLWISTLYNGVCILTDKDNFHRIKSDSKQAVHNRLIETGDGNILLNEETAISQYNERNDKFVRRLLFKEKSIVCLPFGKNEFVVVFSNRIEYYSAQDFKKIKTVNLYPNIVQASLFDKDDIWLASTGILKVYNMKTNKYKQIPESLLHAVTSQRLTITNICGSDKVVISTMENGLYYYNKRTGAFTPTAKSNDRLDVGGYEVQCLFEDSNHNVWVGTRGDGFKVISNNIESFNALDGMGYFQNMSINGMAYDGKGRLWILAFGSKLYTYNIYSGEVKLVKDLHSLGQGLCRDIFYDSNGSVWLITDNHLMKCSYNGSLKIAQAFNLSASFIHEDNRGTIWITLNSPKSALLYLPKGGSNFKFLPANKKPNGYIENFLVLHNGHLLVAYQDFGIYEIDAYSNMPTRLIESSTALAQALGTKIFSPEVLFEDKDTNIWIGTQDNGLLVINRKTKAIKHINKLKCNEISSIEQDRLGNMWVSTKDGLNKFSKNGEFLSSYLNNDVTNCNMFASRISRKLPDGFMVFGSGKGIISFNPLKKQDTKDAHVVFEYLKVNNSLVFPGKNSNIDRSLAFKPDIHLSYDQNNISISYSALGALMLRHSKHFMYQLDGYDKTWVDAGNNNTAVFTNLEPGHYTFRVKLINGQDGKQLTEESIKINISPAPWNTWWARLFYLFVTVAIVYWFIHRRKMAYLRKMNYLKLKNEKEQEQRTNDINKKYFANVAHQLRTPLTMIAGPVEAIVSSGRAKGYDQRLLNIVNHNIVRMLKLVNQLMDFNKLETDALKLKVHFTDITPVIKRTVEIYKVNAEEKGIELRTVGLDTNHFMYADTDKIENILDNLLSNAMKYTSEGDGINITFKAVNKANLNPRYTIQEYSGGKNYAEICVQDSGTGIPEEQLENIFLRYYQVDGQAHGSYNWGTGIGLYYARKLARLHHGDLIAENRKDSHGTIFSLILPTNKEAYTESELNSHIDDNSTEETKAPMQPPVSVTDSSNESTEMNRPLIMVVDDDTDVSYYLKTLLSNNYRVVCHYDADSAEEDMEENMPDLIISDVVMDSRSGFDLCRAIKENPAYCHIPVVLLTAKDTMSDQIEGLEVGADAYVTKPFHADYLLTLVKNLLKNRERIRKALSDATKTDSVNDKDLTPQDKVFMDDLFEMMDKELDNTDFNVAQCVERLHVSHTKFIGKVKALTGQTPSDFFRNYKLNRAAAMLKDGKMNISEVADMTGFSSLAHFSKVFKKKFGVSPSKYVG